MRRIAGGDNKRGAPIMIKNNDKGGKNNSDSNSRDNHGSDNDVFVTQDGRTERREGREKRRDPNLEEQVRHQEAKMGKEDL